jgi:Raf kinase inhibitor-like YbhB/YbcL family protein
MRLTSESFLPGEAIPKAHAYSQGNVSPPLEWSGAPAGTKSFALICDDPDAPKAGGWVHWVLWNIPASASRLESGLPGKAEIAGGIRQGLNDWRELGWGGPEPPSGTHHYSFRIYALDIAPDERARLTRDSLMKLMQGHILAQAELIGTFSAR